MKMLDLLLTVSELKKLKRTGWVREGVPNSETVAEHMFRISFMSLVLAPKSLDMEKLLKMAIVHDTTEAFAGDIVWSRGTKIHRDIKMKKEKLEKEAMIKMCEDLEDGKELLEIWSDYIAQTSKEARFLKEIEKLDLALKAYEYEKEHNLDLKEFYANAKMYLREPDLVKLFEEILELRNKKRKWK